MKTFLHLSVDIYRDPKLLRYLPDAEQRWVWVGLLCLAMEWRSGGRIDETDEDIAFRLGVDVTNVTSVTTALSQCPRPAIERTETGIRLTNWRRHQPYPSDDPEATRARKAAQRERERGENNVTDVTDGTNVTSVTTVTNVTPRGEERRVEEKRNVVESDTSGSDETSAEGKRARTRARATSLPADWEVSDELVARVLKREPRATAADVRGYLPAFRDAVASKDYRYVDWDAVFVNWFCGDVQRGRLRLRSNNRPFEIDSARQDFLQANPALAAAMGVQP